MEPKVRIELVEQDWLDLLQFVEGDIISMTDDPKDPDYPVAEQMRRICRFIRSACVTSAARREKR